MLNKFLNDHNHQSNPYDTNTILGLEFEGINGGNSNLMRDEIHPDRISTTVGIIPIGSHNPFTSDGTPYNREFHGGSACFRIDGYPDIDQTNSYITHDATDCFDFGTNDFTFEFWVKVIGFGSAATLISAGTVDVSIQYLGGHRYQAFGLLSNQTPNLNQWTHIAYCRSNETISCYINGILDSSAQNTTNYGNATSIVLGATYQPHSFNGYIGGIRVIKNTALYTQNFNVPRTKFTNVPGTSFLVNFDTTDIYDISGNVNVWRVGTAAISTTNKRNGNSSVYFNGTTDFLMCGINNQTLNSLTINPSDAYTIESWIYLLSYRNSTIITNGHTINIPPRWELSLNDQGNLLLFISGSSPVLISNRTVQLNQWTHVAACMDSQGNCYIYINGELASNPFVRTVQNNYEANSNVTIGRRIANDFYFHGYMDSLHVIKGVCKYTENFVPDGIILTTDPYSTNNVLLMHMDGTNGSKTFIDSSSASNTITINGDAKISTNRSRFGGSSMILNGTTDSLFIPPSDVFAFGTEDFTIECWFYQSDTPNGSALIADRHGSGGYCYFALGFCSGTPGSPTGSIPFFGCTPTKTSWTGIVGTTLSNNMWHHIAGVRHAGVYKLYINGNYIGGVNYADNIPTDDGINIGKRWDGLPTNYGFNGYIDEVRITKGVARYTTDNFALPTSAFPT